MLYPILNGITFAKNLGQILPKLPIDNSKLQMVNTESLAKGIYLLHIFDGKDTYTQQIVKE